MKNKPFYLISLLVRTGIHPNTLTLWGLFLGVLSCLIFVFTKNWILFCFMLLATALFDFLDGAVARASGQSSPFGAFLDALSDRIYDGTVLIATAYVSGYWLECSLLMLTTFCFSYAKARTALEVSIHNKEWPDLMERGPRSILFFVVLVFDQIFPYHLFGANTLYWGLILLNLLMILSLILRVRRAYLYITHRS